MSHTETIQSDQAEPDAEKLPSRQWRMVLSLFILLNLSTVLYMNRPREWAEKKYEEWTANWDPMTKYRLGVVHWRWQQYAHISGLSNQWQMFGKQSYFNWRYDIRGVYGEGKNAKSVLLPLPNQSRRTLMQAYVFDFKEPKFALNIYRNEFAREAYMRYLAQQFPEHKGVALSEIRWRLYFENILPPDEAVKQQKLTLGEWHWMDFGHYRVPATVKASSASKEVSL